MSTLPINPDAVMVGSYSLESLTTGMYENPLHCLREYVQNAFDAIRTARAEGGLTDDEGLVAIAISGTAKRPTLTVEDNGIGIPAEVAVSTLVSVGASRKRSNINAGFRGIGRLAGVAYCTTLRFTTSFKGEATATVVDFDCGRMRGFMKPSAETQDIRSVILACVSTSEAPVSAASHGTKVEMIGLTGVGVEFAEIGTLVPYLRQVSPTDFSDRFTFADRIRSYADGMGHPIPVVEVETRYKRERTQILKAYDDVTPTAKSRSTIANVETVGSAELGWFGWIGKSNFKGELTDDNVAGVRFRVKNIQIDGSDLIETLAAELTIGGTEGRLQRYAVGEVYITNPSVVPNARRDGFEDGQAWRLIRADIKAKVAKRVITLIREASKSRPKIKKIGEEVDALRRKLAADSIAPADADAVGRQLENLLARLKPEKLTGGEPDEIGNYVSQVKGLKETLKELRTRPVPEVDDGEDRDGDYDAENSEEADIDHAAETEDGNDHPGAPTPDEFLPALRAVMVRELGLEETDRLFELALMDLKA